MKTQTKAGKRGGAGKPERGVMRMRRLAVGKIKTAVYNPRKDLKPDDPEYQKIAASLKKFGVVQPLVWNERSGNLVSGHQRLKILIAEHGVTEVDVSVVNLSPAQEKSLNLALNKVSGQWDETKLADVLRDLSAAEDLAALEASGFDSDERDLILQAQAAEALEETEGGGRTIAEVWGVLVECRSEGEQKKIFSELKKRGLKVSCKTM